MSKAVRRLVKGFKESDMNKNANSKDSKKNGNLVKKESNAEKLIAAAGGMGGMGGPGKAKKMKKGLSDKPKEGDVVVDPEIKAGRGAKVDMEDDPDIEKDKEDE